MGFLKSIFNDPLKAVRDVAKNPIVDAAGLAAGGYFAAPAIGSLLSGNSASVLSSLAGGLKSGFGSLSTGVESLFGNAGSNSLLNGLMSGVGTAMTNDANSANTAAQMEFQRDMSNTAHQREVADLKAAGLNPILSGTGGGGSSSPVGSSFQSQNVLGNAASSAAAAYKNSADVANLKKQNDLISANTNLTQSNEMKVDSERRNLDLQTYNLRNQNDISDYGVSSARSISQSDASRARSARAQADMDEAERDSQIQQQKWQASGAGQFNYRTKSIIDTLNPFGNSAANLRRIFRDPIPRR